MRMAASITPASASCGPRQSLTKARIRLGIRRRLEKPLAPPAALTDRNPHINTNVATLRTKS
jgi:hypothetical protein